VSDFEEALKLISDLNRRRETNKLDYYKPYEWQIKYHNAIGHGTERPAVEKAAICANQIGKTLGAGHEVAMHLTGLYPDWYKGIRFRIPVDWIVAGVTNEVTRDICQNELFGDPKDEAKLGTGSVPRHLIGQKTRKPGVPNAYETVQVKHVSGRWSAVNFKCYEQGPKKFMGLRSNGGWLDEEPPQEILSQVRRSVFSKNPSLILMTFTPEEGATQIVTQLLDEPQQGQAVVRATWDDAPHMTAEVKAQKLATIPVHEREMRTKGVPFAGAGMIFPFSEDRIVIEPFDIPRHWPQIIGLDFGTDHPAAAARLAWDRDNDIVYLISEYKERRAIPAVHAAAILRWNNGNSKWIPVAWPHDGLNTEKSTGDELRKSYSDVGLNMLPARATNPPDWRQGQEEGQGGNSLEASLLAMYERMETGRWKVFRTCREWLAEQRMYHRDLNGKVVKINDDLISASRTANMMLRHARVETVKQRKQQSVAGVSNWG
jgi:phage terminase large subunit-like protein